MHATLAELLENVKAGLVWTGADGLVRFVNQEAARSTGLAVGRRLYDPDMARAVRHTVAMREVSNLVLVGLPSQSGQSAQELSCRVIPGLAQDDCFVLISPDAKKDPNAALQDLMAVIRSDLKEPLNDAQQALALAQASGDTHAMNALNDRIQPLLDTMSRLLDLASVWGHGALFANDRIALWPLLQTVWGEVEPLAMARSIKVRFLGQQEGQRVTMYGSEQWLKRVLTECLESAVRGSRRGAVLEIEHRQMGPRALIVFRDSGVFSHARGSAQPSAQTAPAGHDPLAARDHIGLKLCQHVVALHGGRLREEQEGDSHHFLIDLPTGAPHHAVDAHLDMEQAQQYARDLAALMARSRRTAPHNATANAAKGV